MIAAELYSKIEAKKTSDMFFITSTSIADKLNDILTEAVVHAEHLTGNKEKGHKANRRLKAEYNDQKYVIQQFCRLVRALDEVASEMVNTNQQTLNVKEAVASLLPLELD